MAVCDKWVALKVVEFVLCIACLVAKRVSSDDEARLALLLQKLSREWSLLNSVTWDSVGGSFADAVYGGYIIITFGLLLGRIVQEVPRGRRVLEGWFLGMGMLFFLVLGGLELASLDSVPNKLIVNAAVLGTLSLVVAALFLVDLMGPRIYTAAHHSQTDFDAPLPAQQVTIVHQSTEIKEKPQPVLNNNQNGHIPNGIKDVDVEKNNEKNKKDLTVLFEEPKHGYTKFDDNLDTDELEKSKFGSVRTGIEGGNYVRLSDPLAEPDRLHYEKELAKFNEKYFKEYLDTVDGKYAVKEDYLPEPQTPLFAKVKSGRLKSLYDEVSPNYEQKRASKSPTRVRTVATPTLQQLEDYLRGSSRSRRGDTPAVFPMEPIEERERIDDRASGTPTDRGFVQYSAEKWPEKRDLRTPRHSPTN